MKAGTQWVGGRWVPGSGAAFQSRDPFSGAVVWSGEGAGPEQVASAVAAARQAQPSWERQGVEARRGALQRFAETVSSRRAEIAATISRETGKPRWESEQEVGTLLAKGPTSVEAYGERCAEKSFALGEARAHLRYRAHGVLAVLGPFNLPAHLPHSHLIPSLLAGNTVVFKPSEYAPATAALLAEAWESAGIPPGVVNLVQGRGDVGQALAAQDGIDGLLFTGGVKTGLALSRAFAERPDKILALELGGNNPLVVWDPESFDAAAEIAVQSAFLTAGQRCVCARRLIVPTGAQGEAVLDALLARVRSLVIGRFDAEPPPFFGPVIHDGAAQSVLAAQERLRRAGSRCLAEARAHPDCPRLLSPAVWEVEAASALPDEEVFGPLLQVWRAGTFEEAVGAAAATRFGLSAGLVSRDADRWRAFREGVRAGVVNWNRPLTGASGKLPFGGVGLSGNHRPSAFHAADYCAFPVASVEAPPEPSTHPEAGRHA